MIILNFGHTFGHAIEAATGYGRYLHGEAVAIGMVMAMDISARLGLCEAADAARLQGLIECAGLPVRASGLDSAAILDAMGMDKKVVDGRLRLIVCRGIGRVAVTTAAPRSAVLEPIEAGLETA